MNYTQVLICLQWLLTLCACAVCWKAGYEWHRGRSLKIKSERLITPCPDGYTIVHDRDQVHGRFHGAIYWDQVMLYTAPSSVERGTALRDHFSNGDSLHGSAVLGADLIMWYLEHPREIPPSWKGNRIGGLGTIYRRDSDGELHIYMMFCSLASHTWEYMLMPLSIATSTVLLISDIYSRPPQRTTP
jgi:hypothetical protein